MDLKTKLTSDEPIATYAGRVVSLPFLRNYLDAVTGAASNNLSREQALQAGRQAMEQLLKRPLTFPQESSLMQEAAKISPFFRNLLKTPEEQ